MKKIFTLIFALVALISAQAATYTVAGSAAVLNGSASWAETNADNDMTTTDNVNYTLTISGISVEKGDYEYKVVEDHAWTNCWPSSNAKLNIAENAKYDIVYSFNYETKAVNAIATKVGAFEGSTEKIYTVAGDKDLMGTDWKQDDANHDMKKNNEGIYELILENVTLQAKTYYLKVVVNHDWGTNYPSSNYELVIAEAGTYNVTITFNEATKVVAAKAEKVVVTPAADATFDFENNPQNWPVTTVVFGDEFDAAAVTTLTVSDVVLTSVQNAFYANVIYKNGDAAPAFRVFKGNDFKLTAPEGKAIVKVEVTMAAGQTFDFTADNGAIADGVWTGNAAEVTFSTTATRLIAKIAVTLADENDETIKPAKVDVEVTDIAAFNAIEDGKIAKLTLTNARVNGVMSGNYYVEDATGATVIKGVELTAATALNGFIIGTKSTNNDIDYMSVTPAPYEPQLSATDASTFEATATTLVGTVMSGSEAAAQANYGRLITLENVSISGSGQNKTLTDAEGKTLDIKARDYMGVLPTDYVWPEKASKITGVVIYYMTGWFLMPISADAIVAAGTQKVAEFDFLNNNMDLVIGSTSDANGGNLGGKSVKKDDVTISFVNSSTMPTRYYFNAGKNQLQVIAGGQIRFSAAEGQAITKIEITPVAASNNKWNVDGEVGTLSEDKLTWAGNTTTVRFTATGALYLTNIVVTTAAKNDATITPADNETYTEVSSLAEFNALEKGTLAKLNLTNAVITSGMVNDWGYYVQDATAGAHFYCTGLNFEVNDAINGFVYVKKDFNQPGPRIAMTEKTNADNLEVTHNATYSPVEGTLAEVAVAANNNMVIKLTGVAVKGSTETEATITSGESSLPISNGKTNYAPYVYKENLTDVDYSSATVVGILWSNGAGNTFKLYPLSITEGNGSGIETIHNSQFTVKNSIYNLQGIRLNGLQKGLNIVNGKKVVIK